MDQFILIGDFNPNGVMGACLDTRRFHLVRQSLGTHIAFANDAVRFMVAWHLVGTFPNAVFPPNALIVQVLHDARQGIFFLGTHRASIHALGIHAVMAGAGDRLNPLFSLFLSEPLLNPSPRFFIAQSIHVMTGAYAGFAGGAFVQINLEGVLFTRIWQLGRDQ